MKLKSTLFAVLGGTALLAAAPAFADRGHGHKHHQWKPSHQARHYYHDAPRRVVAVPPPVVYYAPRVYHRPAPVYYPAPAYPISSGISIRFNFPL